MLDPRRHAFAEAIGRLVAAAVWREIAPDPELVHEDHELAITADNQVVPKGEDTGMMRRAG